ncbi:bifunctional diaminohydroxyphosphoribosylaminopyrimidine deaminase/5-amino-6-(5-phosphoribosylamino)uracil reductase RibD [Cytobacillus sp. S13-E01]|uniref:bifunctional diaminohydroxyphosphoribosylaminopyrimidine deaminase/5-amino-6-(5-phosphoribosylamino)uracil reductase RibD n=1 Tax=Cytobacillus sp. S13-E01 TaxID=3031326 RepID=UPI0023D896CC|nr:bifunctional diaminohydroxyphosphoribosylaminopyrimidine deaminase/5-amino-6-(5-phosphoribosylamino)uracil reductase RibD [Cytobacillus sp. S13-E01]MDF0726157.1 bifunctional diaminohydroxyphosphoribosylaminopyrimidine deaminase/5-amino-6-(5-phosphoribosylamino)uracil reductase RibD [Cytobacillus sp. S13-E01]
MLDNDYMKLAINVARAGVGQTAPNPVVGAVIVKDGRVVGVGAHLRSGEPHAEVHAIRMAGENAKESTVYVTLEPCSHHGKTPPCAELLIENRVKRVVIATTDPNPLVAGNGIKRLESAGIAVEVGLLKAEADDLNKIFYHNIEKKLPYVTLKAATSLDGKIATAKGESKWITGPEARLDVHKYRHQHDAILVGVNTVIADDPSLTTRLPNGGKNPIRVIMDTHLRTPLNSKVITDGEALTWLIVGNQIKEEVKKRYTEKGVRVFVVPFEKIVIKDMLKILAENGITSVFVEGGSQVNGSFVKEKAVDQVIMYIAPKIIGGNDAPSSIGGSGFDKIAEVFQLSIQSVEQIGSDIKIISVPTK